MKWPRFIHRIYANISGYFWHPCPICGNYFGGHEWDYENGHTLQKTGNIGIGVCSNCGDEAKKRNKENGFITWQNT